MKFSPLTTLDFAEEIKDRRALASRGRAWAGEGEKGTEQAGESGASCTAEVGEGEKWQGAGQFSTEELL